MGLTNLVSNIALRGIDKDPRYQKLQADYDELISRSEEMKEIDPDYTNETFQRHQSYKTYSRYIGFFVSLYGITGIAYTVLFVGGFFYLFSDSSTAFGIIIGSFIGSIGYLISPLGAKFDYLDSFSVVRLILCMPILCLNILVFSSSWLILVPIIALLSLIVAFILNKVYI